MYSRYFIFNSSRTEIVTKRIILSTIVRLFDPLGLLSLIIISAKIIQEHYTGALYKIFFLVSQIDPLPDPIINKWSNFLDNIGSEQFYIFTMDRM